MVEQLHAIGNRSTWLIVLTSVFTGMVLALQGYNVLVRFGSESWWGSLVGADADSGAGSGARRSHAQSREPARRWRRRWGNMRLTEQIDAIRSMGVDSIQYLATPRLVASVVAGPLLTTVFILSGIGAAYVFCVTVLGLEGSTFTANVRRSSSGRTCGRVCEIIGIRDWHGVACDLSRLLCVAWCSGSGSRDHGGRREIAVLILIGDYVMTALMSEVHGGLWTSTLAWRSRSAVRPWADWSRSDTCRSRSAAPRCGLPKLFGKCSLLLVGDLSEGAVVKLAGVTVARSIEYTRELRGSVVMRIDRYLKMPTDTIASVKTEGLLGEAYVSLSPGAADADIADGGRISQTEPPIDLFDVVEKYAFDDDDSEVSKDREKDPVSGSIGVSHAATLADSFVSLCVCERSSVFAGGRADTLQSETIRLAMSQDPRSQLTRPRGSSPRPRAAGRCGAIPRGDPGSWRQARRSKPSSCPARRSRRPRALLAISASTMCRSWWVVSSTSCSLCTRLARSIIGRRQRSTTCVPQGPDENDTSGSCTRGGAVVRGPCCSLRTPRRFSRTPNTTSRVPSARRRTHGRRRSDVGDRELLELETAKSFARLMLNSRLRRSVRPRAGCVRIWIERRGAHRSCRRRLEPIDTEPLDLPRLARVLERTRPELLALREGAVALEALADAEDAGAMPDCLRSVSSRRVHRRSRLGIHTLCRRSPTACRTWSAVGVRWAWQAGWRVHEPPSAAPRLPS